MKIAWCDFAVLVFKSYFEVCDLSHIQFRKKDGQKKCFDSLTVHVDIRLMDQMVVQEKWPVVGQNLSKGYRLSQLNRYTNNPWVHCQ